MELTFKCQSFETLSTHQLYHILQLRQSVFIVEQTCIFNDCDGLDVMAHHLQGFLGKTLVAYSRLLPVGSAFSAHASIGRVVTHPDFRRAGYGRPLMRESLLQSEQLFAGAPLRIGAQSYLLEFYSSFGFIDTGHNYIEDEIAHTHMDYTHT